MFVEGEVLRDPRRLPIDVGRVDDGQLATQGIPYHVIHGEQKRGDSRKCHCPVCAQRIPTANHGRAHYRKSSGATKNNILVEVLQDSFEGTTIPCLRPLCGECLADLAGHVHVRTQTCLEVDLGPLRDETRQRRAVRGNSAASATEWRYSR